MGRVATRDARALERAERTAERAQAKLLREREASAAKLARQRARLEELHGRLEELHGSYLLSGARKKLDLRRMEGFSEIADEIVADRRTGMQHDRLFTLWQAVRAAPQGEPAIEIGSYRGGTARFISLAFEAARSAPAPLYVCDTFSGPVRTNPSIDGARRDDRKFEDVSAASTASYLSDRPEVQLVVGDIAETSSHLPERSYGFVHVDVNFHPATAFCVRHFAPRLAASAMMVIDDYGHTTCPGVKQAADEFVAEFPEYRLWHLLTGQALLWRVT